MTLTFNTFTQASKDAGVSRLYGGIHFGDGNKFGGALSRIIGQEAFLRAQGEWLRYENASEFKTDSTQKDAGTHVITGSVNIDYPLINNTRRPLLKEIDHARLQF